MSTEHATRRAAADEPGTGDALARTAGDGPPAGGAGERQHYESFLWRLRLGEDATIADTSIQHVGTGETKCWSSWDTADMLAFIKSRVATVGVPAEAPAAVEPPAEAPAAAAAAGEAQAAETAELPETAEEVRPEQHPPLAAEMRIDTPVVHAGQRLETTLTLDFGPAGGAPYRMVYAVAIMARRLDGDLHRTVARENGVLEAGRSGIAVRTDGLPAGLYLLDAAVTLRKPSIGLRGSTALVEGTLVNVLPG